MIPTDIVGAQIIPGVNVVYATRNGIKRAKVREVVLRQRGTSIRVTTERGAPGSARTAYYRTALSKAGAQGNIFSLANMA